MERDYGMEIDALKTSMEEIKKLLTAAYPSVDAENGGWEPAQGGEHIGKMKRMHPVPEVQKLIDDDTDKANERGWSGAISYVGMFESGGRQSNWANHGVNTDDLLKFIEDGTAEKVLSCIGSADRLNLLLAILRKPSTVAELVERCGLNSTGQAYHHLNQLIACDLIAEDDCGTKGTYVVKPHRVQGIIMLLAGVHDIVDA